MNLPDLIKTGESNTIEFKEKFDERTVESAVAFANTKGGTIFIGVSDKNNIKGIKIGKETINQWTNQISQSTDPRIIPEIEQIKVSGKTVIAVKIKENPIKPVSTKGRCLKRVDSSNRAMSAQEVAQMHLHSTEMSWDKYPARNAKLADIDLDDGVGGEDMSMDKKVSPSSLVSPGINSWMKQRRKQLIIESFLTVYRMWMKSMAQKFNG